MLKNPIYIFLLITLFIFSVSCNKIPDNISEDNQPSIADEYEINILVINSKTLKRVAYFNKYRIIWRRIKRHKVTRRCLYNRDFT